MDKGKDWKELTSELKTFTLWAISSLIDGVFLAFWVLIQWLVSKVVLSLELSGIDQWMLYLFQLLFAISTLVPVIIYIYVDISVMVLRARRRIQYETVLGKANDINDGK